MIKLKAKKKTQSGNPGYGKKPLATPRTPYPRTTSQRYGIQCSQMASTTEKEMSIVSS